ncbi:MAG: hypothetical protein F9K30_23265 [Dechloromonas sp.]|nr:MAG: hypothetical protein F9K30_23265 [Dechloromonas sp.]
MSREAITGQSALPAAGTPLWLAADGRPIGCHEKIRVLDENFRELRQMLVDALEDGVLMGADEGHLRACFARLAGEVPLAFAPGSLSSGR